MAGRKGYYAKCKSDRERQMSYDLTYMWNEKQNKTKNQAQRGNNKLMAARDGNWWQVGVAEEEGLMKWVKVGERSQMDKHGII